MTGDAQYERAKARVMRSPKLRPLAEYILVDWGEDHFKWVATARIGDIADWAQTIKRDSDLEEWHRNHAN